MLVINNHVWDIRFVSPTDEILLNSNGQLTLGVTVPEWHTIYIANNIHGQQLRHVLAHEITHAQIVSRGLHVPPYTEEVLADWVADNTLDIANTTDDICRYFGRC